MTVLGVFLFNRIRTGGDRRYLELMEGLAERGNTVLVLMNTFLKYTPLHFRKIELSIKYRYRKFPPASYLFREEIKKNLKSVKKELSVHGKIDLIHIHGDTSLKAALFLKKKLRLPLFYAFRCNDIDRARILRQNRALTLRQYLFSLIYEPVNRSREKQAARFAELVTFQNSADRDRFLERTGYDEKRTLIIPGNIGPPRCAPEWKDKNRSKSVDRILYVGSLNRDKGLFDLLPALKLLLDRGIPHFHCHLLGRGDSLEVLEGMIRKYGLSSHITVEGYKDPFPFYSDCDLLVYPSLYDAFPDTVLEALHTGCPVIASDAGGIPDILQQGELLFKTGDVPAVADKIERCIKDAAYYLKIRELCSERAGHFQFDWAEKFEGAMEKL